MISVAGRSGLVVVALATILVGVLFGSGMALAYSESIEKEVGWNVYTNTFEDCYIYDCEYEQHVTGRASSDWEEFKITGITYNNASAEDGVRFGIMYIFDMRGENTDPNFSFICLEIDGAYRNTDVYWYWDEHDPEAYGTTVSQYIWYDPDPCGGAVAYAGVNDMDLYVE